MTNETEERLKDINRENSIFLIFLGIIFLAYLANEVEKKYFTTYNPKNKQEYYYIQCLIFIIVVIINIYYVYNSYKVLLNITPDMTENNVKYAYLDFMASVVALFAGLILLYIALTDTELESEITI